MDDTFSFRYIKLGVALVSLLISSIIPGLGQYVFAILGGIALTTTFASFGNYDYRGLPCKSIYKIARFLLAISVLIIAGIQVYAELTMSEQVHYTIYANIIDCALIAYLLFYKPSNSSMIMKVWKSIGYILILLGVNTLQNTKNVVEHLTYTPKEINWSMVCTVCIMSLIGIVCVIISSRKKPNGVA